MNALLKFADRRVVHTTSSWNTSGNQPPTAIPRFRTNDLRHPRQSAHAWDETGTELPDPTRAGLAAFHAVWFSKVEGEVIVRGIFTSVADLAREIRR